MFAQLCEAVQFLHERRIVHRDIKLQNVLIKSDGHILLTDFGVAKFLDFTNQTQQTIVGSLLYLPPEMLKDSRDFALPSDVYSLGVLLYTLYMNNPPFSGQTPAIVIHSI